MRHGRILLAVISLALLSCAQDLAQNSTIRSDVVQPNCQPIKNFDITKYEYNCSGIILSTYDNENSAKIDCYGAQLDCAKLPKLSYAEGRVLRHLSLSNCAVQTLSCALATLNASGVSTLTYRAVSTPLTADALIGLDMVESLMIYGPPKVQTTVPVEALKVLPQLEMLRLVQGGLTTLPPYAFNTSGTPKMKFLEVSLNDIKSLTADSFNGLPNLETLSLYKNNIEEINVDAFKGLDSLKNLYLDDNNLSVLTARLFVSTPQLRVLTLRHNQRALRLQTAALTGLGHLEQLVLQSYGELTLEPASLSHLPSLTSADLSNSGVKTLPADLFLNTTALVNLTLNGNELRSLPANVFADLSSLRKLDLSRNKLEELNKSVFQPLEQIRELYLDQNLIKVLNEKSFTSRYLNTLGLSHNRISEVHEGAFGASALENLDLSHNALAWRCRSENELIINYKYIDLGIHSPLEALTRLEKLDLSHNSISDVCGDWTYLMLQLRTLDLSYNNLTQLTAADVNFLSHPITVNFENNHITTLEPHLYMENIPSLKLSHNPFNCNCHLYHFLRLLKQLPYDVQQATCRYPAPLRDCSLDAVSRGGLCRYRSVSLSELTCPLKAPSGCECVVRPEMERTECDCDDLMDKTLPNPELNGENINKMQLKLHSLKNSTFPNFVTMLNLSGLSLHSIPDLPKHLTFIDLSENRLNRVPIEFLKRNLSMKLENNPLECDCLNADDVENLQTYQTKVEDYRALVCKDGVYVSQVDVARLCYVELALAYGLSLAFIGITLAIIIIFGYKYSLEIRLWLFSKGCTCFSAKEDIEDREKPFDIFLSYVHQDEKFVAETLLPKLEERYKVCIHTRDWIIGESILNQIYRSVAESRRTLIVLSNAYIQSESWAQEEFRAAYLQTARDGRPRCVVVLLEDVNLDNAPEQIKTHINLNTYIEWKDKKFWDRLYYAVPKKLKAKHVRRRAVTEKAVKALNGGLNVIVNDQGKLVNVPAVKDSCVA